MRRVYTQDILGDINECPCSGTGQPTVLGFTVEFCISSGNHLCIYVRFCSVNFTDFLCVSGTCLLIYFKCSVTASDYCLGNGNPRIVVAEDTCIFLVSGWIRADFTKLKMIFCISRLQNHDTIFRIQLFFYGIQCFLCKSFLHTDACK